MAKVCSNCSNPRRPIRYAEDGESFCSHQCLIEWWSKKSELSARSRGLCPECLAKHKTTEPHVGWMVKPESQPNA